MFDEIINMWLYLHLSPWIILMVLGSLLVIGLLVNLIWKKHENIIVSDVIKPVVTIFIYAYIVKIVGVALLIGFEQIGFVNMFDVYSSIWSIVIHFIVVILSGWALYRVYHQYFMRHTKKLETAYDLSKILAIVTAPYMFLIPAGWFF